MADNRSVFERLNNIELTAEETKKMVSEVLAFLKTQQNEQSVVASNQNTTQAKPQPQQQLNDKNIIIEFVRKSRKLWMWFGTLQEFKHAKVLSTIFISVMIGLTILSTVITGISLKQFSPFSIFEMLWIFFGIYYLGVTIQAKYKCETFKLASSTNFATHKDELGYYHLVSEKKVFKIFRWIAVLFSVLNIVMIWVNRSNISILATIFELLFIVSLFISGYFNASLFVMYDVAYVEGRKLGTGESLVLIHMPGQKGFMTLDDAKIKIPFLFK